MSSSRPCLVASPDPGDRTAGPGAEPLPVERPTLQASLDRPVSVDPARGGPAPLSTITDPVPGLRHLEVTGRFHRDTGWGRVFHPGATSLRENVRTNSLHVVVHADRILAHVDRVSPLGARPESPSRYSLRRAVAHNIMGMGQDTMRLLRGRQGDHRSELNCDWLPGGDQATPDGADLLDPATSAWSLHIEARVAGEIDETGLRAAVVAAVGGAALPAGCLDAVDCQDEAAVGAARDSLHSLPVAITQWPPFQLRLAHHRGGDVVMLNLNHAAGDGFAAMRLLCSVAAAYRGEPVEPLEFLAAQDLPVRPASAPRPAVLQSYRTGIERLRDRLSRPARLAPEQAEDRPGHGFRLRRLSAEDTRGLLGGEGPGTRRNVLMAALHLAIGDWNLRHGTPGRRIGVLTPVNLRPDDWREETIGNLSVTARVSTSRRHRSGPAAALRAVRGQTTRNKRCRTGIAFIAALERTDLSPLWAKQSLVVLQPLTGNRFVDTAMLANLGAVEEGPWFGPAAGETAGVWFSTPARSPGSLCLGAVVVEERLHLTFRYPHRLFGPATADRFADCFLEHVRRVADSRRSAP